MSPTGAAACCTYSTLEKYEETNKATSAAPEEADDAKQNRHFDWQENSANLRKLAKADRGDEIMVEGV
jgi:hypothetical protein